MDEPLTPPPPSAPARGEPRWRLGCLTALLIAGLLAALFLVDRHEKAKQAEELAQTQGLVKVLSATFSRQSALKVGEVSGQFDVTTVDPGAFEILRSAQKVKLPYSIDYTVDLSALSPRDYRYDGKTKTLLVEAPAVVVGRPNIDEARRQTLATSGLFVTRQAADNLSRRAAVLANGAATREAQRPEQIAKARDNARRAIAAMLETPLDVAGLGGIKVVVHFPADGYRSDEHWDVSPSIAEVLARDAAKR